MPIINQVVKGGGTQPSGTIQITTNGTHDVTNYANADVQVPATGPTYYLKRLSNNGSLIRSNTFIDLTDVTNIGDYALYYAYYKLTPGTPNFAVDMSGITTINGYYACYQAFAETSVNSFDLSNLTTITGYMACYYMFYNCARLSSVDLHSLTTIGDGSEGTTACRGMFYNCTGITSVDLSSLTSIKAQNACQDMFRGCTRIASVDLSSLTSVTGQQGCNNMFNGCTGLTTVEFSSLEDISGSQALYYMFLGCTSLSSLSFPALKTTSFGSNTNQFFRLLSGVTGCTVHFPMAIQSTIGSWSDVTGGFNGTNTTVLFDIVTTLTGADSHSYTRKQKESTSTATAWTYNSTLYYTSGTTEPTVGATIYSDSACTTAVTTVSAIA